MNFRKRARLYIYVFAVSASLLLLGMRNLSLFIGAYGQSKYFCGPFSDGSLEHLNPLARISAGQIPGHAFQVLHGLGLPYLHFPFYLLLGKNLFASEATKDFFPPIFFFLSNFGLLWVITRRKGPALILSAAVMLLADRLYPNLLLPGVYVSLGVRTAFPIFVGSLIIWLERKKKVSIPLVTLTLALTFLITSEQGLSALLAFPLVLIFFAEAKNLRERLMTTASAVLFSVGWVLLVFFIVSGRYLFEPLRYFISEVPGDEFWFFGTMNPPYATIGDILRSPYIAGVFTAGIVLLGVIFFLNRKKHLGGSLGISFLLFYGLLTLTHLLESVDNGRATILARVDVMAVIWLCLSYFPKIKGWLDSRLAGKQAGRRANVPLPVWGLASLGAAAVLFLIIEGEVVRISGSLTDLNKRRADSYLGSTVSGVYLCNSGYINWKLHLDTLAKYIPQLENPSLPGPTPSLWSTFAGIPEYLLGQFNPASDYIDHALGPTRRRDYLATFRQKKPDYVVTIRRSPYPAEWLEDNYWDFYRTVLVNYRPVDVSMFGIIWKKAMDNWADSRPRWDNIITGTDGAKEVTLTVGQPYKDKDLLEVEVSYKIDNPWKRLPVLGLTPKFILNIENADFNTVSVLNLPISLAPYETKKIFPIVLASGVDPKLSLETISDLPGVGFSLTGIRYRVLNLTPETKRLFLDLRQ